MLQALAKGEHKRMNSNQKESESKKKLDKRNDGMMSESYKMEYITPRTSINVS